MGCKHYVKGTAYQAIEEKFYVVPMNQPTYSKEDRSWSVSKYRIVVSVQDEAQEERCKSYIEFSYTPLRQVGKKRTDFQKVLHDNAVASNILKNDCRPGSNDGSMTCSGNRWAKKLIKYVNTTKHFPSLLDSADRYFTRYGFGKWVFNLRRVMVRNGITVDGVKFPWVHLSATTENYGNECHVDSNDAVLGITIWDERVPMNDRTVHAYVKNWYFLFPDLEILVGDQWREGVAIPLQHGTVVAWDSRFLRHCTAVPTLVDKKSAVWGTYFRIQKILANKCFEPKQKWDKAKRKRDESSKNLIKKSK